MSEALINPELLVWARKHSGYALEPAAKKIGITPERLDGWEKGRERPTIAQLRKAGQVYKRPLAFFYLPTPPKGFSPMKDFRRALDHAPTLSPDLTLNIRYAWERREAAIELYELAQLAPQPFALSADVEEDPIKVATRIRDFLGISVDEQFSWKKPEKAFAAWVALLERRDVLVFQTHGVPSEEARGFSIGADTLPAVIVNGKDTAAGRTFTLFHEFTHVMLRANVICDLEEHGRTIAGHGQIEVFCNRVSASVLMPPEVLITEPEVSTRSGSSPWSDNELDRLSKRYGVSQEAMLRQLRHLKKVDKSFYDAKIIELAKLYKGIDKERGTESKWGPPPEVVVLKRNGGLLAQLVLSAYDSGNITASEVYDYLGIKPKHLDALHVSLAKRSA